MSQPAVSAIISTYNRPDTLAVALTSIALQTNPAEEIIVVGDNCDERTQKVIETFASLPIRYINLPVRCGEQSLPNAVGSALANSEYVAFLNHDDLWFPIHLETGLRQLAASDRSWFIGASLFSHGSEPARVGERPLFTEVTRGGRSCERAFSRTLRYLEPVSTWIIPREALLAAGNWIPAWQTHRTPVSTLALRLWRELGEPLFSDDVTGAKILGASKKTGRYSSISDEHIYLADLLDRMGRDWPDDCVLEQADTSLREKGIDFDWRGNPEPLLRKLRRAESSRNVKKFLKTGDDYVEQVLTKAGFEPGDRLRRGLKIRTGELELPHRTVAELLELIAQDNRA